MNVTIIGTGYVGLVTGTCLADLGNNVLCMDLDARKIDTLNSGGIPIYEPGLSDLVESNIAAKRLSFTTDIEASVAGNRFAAWWPSSKQSSDQPAETWSYTVHLADGSTRRAS